MSDSGNFGSSGGALYTSNRAFLMLNNSLCTSNFADFHGGCVFLDDDSRMRMVGSNVSYEFPFQISPAVAVAKQKSQ